MDVRRRFVDTLLVAGGVALAASVPVMLRYRSPSVEAPWLIAMAVFLGAAAYTWRRLPNDRAAWWFAISGASTAAMSGADAALVAAMARDVGATTLAWIVLAHHLLQVVTVGAMAHLFGMFPDGRPRNAAEQVLPRLVWVFLVFPPIVFLTSPTLLFPSYYAVAPMPNPYAISGLASIGGAAAAVSGFSQAMFGLGVVLLALRYRRSERALRRRIRWLLVPAVGALFGVLLEVVFHAATEVLAFAYPAMIVATPLSIAVALLRPNLFDVDVVLRKSLVYGVLWFVIASAYVAAAAGLGVAAGQRFSVGLAILLTVVATLVFQPARRWLERLADRWVFGVRADPAHLVGRLGAALEETVELERLLPRMATTLEEGLGLRWARVRLEPVVPAGDEEPVLTVPIVLDGERMGLVECGPKRSGAFTADDEAVVTTLAQQAALAVRNVRLTAELERSRARLVRAQDAERRRIERNIHDGVQQGLVALIADAGRVRSALKRDPVAGEQSLAELQEGLRRVVLELRELAHGIHPSVLGDRGLLEAVEALAARSNVPVSVRADPTLRGLRFDEDIEGAGYFTIAEALANVSKHATATHAEVSLARENGALRIAVCDDGAGFDLANAVGEGLANLAERLAALGGRLDVQSAPGHGTTVTAKLQVSGA